MLFIHALIGKKRKEQHDANQTAGGANYPGAYGAVPPASLYINFLFEHLTVIITAYNLSIEFRLFNF